MNQLTICKTGNGDPPPKKPPTEQPARRHTDTPQESDAEDTK